MKRLLASALLLVALAGLLSGCGGTATAEKPNASTAGPAAGGAPGTRNAAPAPGAPSEVR